MLFHRISILHFSRARTVDKLACRPVSSHVLVRAKSERSDWFRLEF